MDTDYENEELNWLREHVRGFVRTRKAYSNCECADQSRFGCFPSEVITAKFRDTLTSTWGVRNTKAHSELTDFFYRYWRTSSHSR